MISKAFVGVSVMMLVDEGNLKLYDPVEKYLPEFKGQMLAEGKDTSGLVTPDMMPQEFRGGTQCDETCNFPKLPLTDEPSPKGQYNKHDLLAKRGRGGQEGHRELQSRARADGVPGMPKVPLSQMDDGWLKYCKNHNTRAASGLFSRASDLLKWEPVIINGGDGTVNSPSCIFLQEAIARARIGSNA